MSIVQFLETSYVLLQGIISTVRDVSNGRMNPVDGAAEVRKLTANVFSNDAAIDESVDLKFDKG